jgi:hypothetical protein
MKTKEIIKRARGLPKPFRVGKSKNFWLKEIDSNNTPKFTRQADKARAKQALANRVTAGVHGHP